MDEDHYWARSKCHPRCNMRSLLVLCNAESGVCSKCLVASQPLQHIIAGWTCTAELTLLLQGCVRQVQVVAEQPHIDQFFLWFPLYGILSDYDISAYFNK